MIRLSSGKRILATLIAVLLPLAGASVLVPAPATAASKATDLRPQVIYYQRTAQTAYRDATIASMETTSAFQNELWAGFVSYWDAANKGVKINTTTPSGLPTKGHVFVVLGSALSSSGTITAKLERRMKIALSALTAYPNSKVLVSGGAAKNGRTEAAVMRTWLISKGVSSSRILVEDKSSSTISNATNSMAILAKSSAYTSYTLISDVSHIRRASILFTAAKVLIQEKSGQVWKIDLKDNVAYPDSTTASRGPVNAATHEIISSNVASVFGVLSAYNGFLSKAPAAPAPAAVTPVTPKLTSIKVTAPKVVTYSVGQPISLSGLAVTALFDNGGASKKVTTAAKITGFSSKKVGTVTVKVAYTEAGVTKTATFGCKIVKAASKVKLKLSTTKIKKAKTNPTLSASVAAVKSTTATTGTVKVYLDGKKIATVTLKAGKPAKVKLGKIRKAGKHKITVRYLGSSTVKAADTKLTIKVS